MALARRRRELLDELDLGIIKTLIEHGGRTSLSEIARLLNSSVGTVKRRLERLQELGVIREIAPLVDPQLLGLHTCVIMLKLKKPGADELLRILSNDPRVLIALKTAGEFDIIAITTFRDAAELSSLINSLLATGLIARSVTAVVLEVAKLSWKLPLA